MATKYTMDVSVTGNAEKKLDDIANGLTKVASHANQLNSSAKKAGGEVEEIASSTKTSALSSLGDQLQALGDKFNEFYTRIRTVGEDFAKEVVKDAATFEDAQSEMRFAFKDDWESVMKGVLKDSADLTFTFEQTSRLASSLGRMKINPFGGTDQEHQLFLSRNGEKIRALSVLQDTADAVGKSADDLVVSIRNAMSGSWKSLQDRFDIPKDKIQAWRKEIEQLKDPQEKYNKLVSELALMFGGAGLEKAGNWNKTIAQVPDLLQQIRAAAGGPVLREMSKGVQELVDVLAKVAKDENTMKALSEGFRVFGEAFAWGTRQLAGFIGWSQKLINQMPWLPKAAAIFVMVAGAFTAFSAAAISAALGVGALVTAFAAIGWEFVVAGLLAAGPLLLLVGGALGVFALASKATADTMERDWSGIGGTLQKIKIGFEALNELISSYNGTTGEMSVETADKLKKAGIMDFVLSVFNVFHKLNVMWDEFMDTIDDISDEVGPTLLPMLAEMGDLIYELADAFGLVDAASKANASTTEDWSAAGRELGHIVIEITKGLVFLTRTGVAFARLFVVALKPVISVMSEVWHLAEKIAAAVSKFGGAISSFGRKLGIIDDKGLGGDKANPRPFWRPDAKINSGDMFDRRRAGGKYRDAEGNFDPFQDPEAAGLLKNGKSKEEILKLMIESGKWTQEDLKRMARGRDKRARAKGGQSYEELYGMATDGSVAGLIDSAAISGPITGDPNAEARKMRSAVDKANKESDTRLQNELLMQIRDIMKADRVTHVEIDGKVVATSSKKLNMGVAGE